MSSPPTADVGFVQQGQVDWVAFARTIVPLSIEVLGRLQGAGVQPITYAGIMQLSSRFKLPELGRQRLWTAIESVQVYNAASNPLYFGFGHRSFFRTLTETVSGLKCIALCSCLAEMHSEPVAAQILSTLWHEIGYPEDFEPSLEQFRALIKACGGVLTKTPFPELANRMFPSFPIWHYSSRCSEPKDIAKALIGLFDISMGHKKSITVVGGDSCAFIAAVAHWIFNFEVYVDDDEGNVLFSSSVTGRPLQPSSAQVHVQHLKVKQRSGVVISQSTFLLNDPKELFIYTATDKLLLLRRRVPWDRCLQDTFGKAFSDLQSLQTTLGAFLGSVARINQALSEGQVDVGEYDRTGFIDFVEASYGHGFISSAQEILPELSTPTLRRHMESVLSQSFQAAEGRLEESLLALKRNCGCLYCLDSFESSQDICLQSLAATIVDLISTVASIQFDGDCKMQPTFEGLKALYESNDNRIHREEGSKHQGWKSMFARWKRSYNGASYPPMHQLGTMLEEALLLFTGNNSDGGDSAYNSDLPTKPRIAISASGICVFIEGIVSMTARADLLRRIHVMPGRIGRSSPGNPQGMTWEYDSISDVINWPTPTLETVEVVPRYSQSGAESTLEYEESQAKQTKSHLSFLGDQSAILDKLDMSAELVESGEAREITMMYRILTPHGEIIIPPGKITMGILENTGLVPCGRSKCKKQPKISMEVFKIKKGWVLNESASDALDLPMSVCFDWEHVRKSDVGRLAALAVQLQMADHANGSRKQMETKAIMRRFECLTCCIRLADKTGLEASDTAMGFRRAACHII